jgi:hypothetical protein
MNLKGTAAAAANNPFVRLDACGTVSLTCGRLKSLLSMQLE